MAAQINWVSRKLPERGIGEHLRERDPHHLIGYLSWETGYELYDIAALEYVRACESVV